MPARFRIAARFSGPPGSGNGGYVAGCLAVRAGHLPGEALRQDGAAGRDSVPATHGVAVRLHAPPPLERELALEAGPSELRLMDGERPIATARAAVVTLEVPPAPTLAQAEAAAAHYAGFTTHLYPSCFVCGTQRAPGDGLRIFPGPLGPRVAAPWCPDRSLAGAGGSVATEFLWAALDCPGGYAFEHPPGGAVLLGEMRAATPGRVEIGEPCVVVGWEVSRSGRKHVSATALYGADGTCRGRALATWLEVAAAPG